MNTKPSGSRFALIASVTSALLLALYMLWGWLFPCGISENMVCFEQLAVSRQDYRICEKTALPRGCLEAVSIAILKDMEARGELGRRPSPERIKQLNLADQNTVSVPGFCPNYSGQSCAFAKQTSRLKNGTVICEIPLYTEHPLRHKECRRIIGVTVLPSGKVLTSQELRRVLLSEEMPIEDLRTLIRKIVSDPTSEPNGGIILEMSLMWDELGPDEVLEILKTSIRSYPDQALVNKVASLSEGRRPTTTAILGLLIKEGAPPYTEHQFANWAMKGTTPELQLLLELMSTYKRDYDQTIALQHLARNANSDDTVLMMMIDLMQQQKLQRSEVVLKAVKESKNASGATIQAADQLIASLGAGR